MQDSSIAFAQINALESGEATASFNITTFPHLLIFKGVDNFRKYRGSLKETEWVFWTDICRPVIEYLCVVSWRI